MTLILARDGYSMSYACGTDLGSDWDNAQAALVVGELNALDWFYGANVRHTKPKSIKVNPGPASMYQDRLTDGRIRGHLSTTHYLQTGILTHNILGACTTGGAGPYTHAITKATTTAPTCLAFHYEKEGATANRRKDMEGFIPNFETITCSEKSPKAFQTYDGHFAYTGAGADLATPNKFAKATHKPYDWYNYRSSSGTSAFTYNTGAINVQIKEFQLKFGWLGEPQFGAFDSNGYPTEGLVTPPFYAVASVGLKLTDAGGTNIDTIADTDPDSYTGDLDFIVDFYESANRFLIFTFDKMMVDVDSYEEVFQGEDGSWYDGVKLDLILKDSASSLAVSETNALNKTYYEND